MWCTLVCQSWNSSCCAHVLALGGYKGSRPEKVSIVLGPSGKSTGNGKTRRCPQLQRNVRRGSLKALFHLQKAARRMLSTCIGIRRAKLHCEQEEDVGGAITRLAKQICLYAVSRRCGWPEATLSKSVQLKCIAAVGCVSLKSNNRNTRVIGTSCTRWLRKPRCVRRRQRMRNQSPDGPLTGPCAGQRDRTRDYGIRYVRDGRPLDFASCERNLGQRCL